MTDVDGGIANLKPLEQAREQKAWYWYDWANSAYTTTIGTVFFGPYFINLAENAVGGEDGRFEVAGLSLPPDSLFFWLITVSTILSALILPPLGAYADRVANKKRLLATLAWTGSFFAALIFFATGDNWQLAAVGIVLGNLFFGAAGVVNDSILPLISDEDDRDRVSSRGWAFGYLGGGLLLALELALVTYAESPGGLSTGWAVRICLAGAGLWWAAFTVIPYRRLRDRPARVLPGGPDVPAGAGLVRGSFLQLVTTLRDARHFPMTLTFLVAYLFYNDGIQTVITASSVYGQEQLGFDGSVLIATILVVQFVAFGGALLFGRIATRAGSRRTIVGGLFVWILVVAVAFVLPAGEIAPFLVLATAIGLVLGGTQALSRSFYSQLVPRGREAEYFSLYQACERGTSWLGTLVFGLVHQMTDSYRPAILALVVFFVVGLVLLMRVDARRGIAQAGNAQPVVV
jgi:MFS transporter, UMF1 family